MNTDLNLYTAAKSLRDAIKSNQADQSKVDRLIAEVDRIEKELATTPEIDFAFTADTKRVYNDLNAKNNSEDHNE